MQKENNKKKNKINKQSLLFDSLQNFRKSFGYKITQKMK